MAVLGASRAFKDWKTLNKFLPAGEEGEIVEGEESNIEMVEAAQDFNDRELQALEDEDPLTLIDSISTRVGTKLASPSICRSRLDTSC